MKVKKVIGRMTLVSGFLLIMTALGYGQDIKYNFMPGVNFSLYTTYQWAGAENQKYPDQIIDAQIKTSINNQLALRGLRLITEGNPDLIVTYQVAIRQQQEWSAYGGGGWRIGMGSASATSSTINIGTLVIDIYEVSGKRQVWTGSATKQLNPSKDPAKNQKNLDKAMAKLLKNYPPPLKK